MFKLLKNTVVYLTIILSSLFTGNTFAGLISSSLDSADTPVFISYNGYDLTWASSFNIQFYGEGCTDSLYPNLSTNGQAQPNAQWVNNDDNECNQLMSADYHQGWQFFETLNAQDNIAADLDAFLIEIIEDRFKVTYDVSTPIMAAFQDLSGNLIQSFDYWNTGSGASHNEDAFFNVASDWTEQTTNIANVFQGIDMRLATSTVYIRKQGGVDPKPVPEPSTLLTFAIGLIALASKKRLIK